MTPELIAFATATLGKFGSSLAVDIGKKKTLSFLEKQGNPIINHHLARALVRALSRSLVKQLNAWLETPNGKQNNGYAKHMISQLQVISNDTNEINADWTVFLEKFNNTALCQSLEAVRSKRPMQASDLGKKAMESLNGFYLDPKKNQKALSDFCDFLSKENGAKFNRNLYECFRYEIITDSDTFKTFTIDFLSQIYANVERDFPNADALADTLSSFQDSYVALWETASSLKSNKLLILRPFNDYYYEREEDTKIRKAINDGKNVLVTGRPLEGKTRSIHEALIKIPNCVISIPKWGGSNFKFVEPTFPGSKKIFVFDDLNIFAHDIWVNKFLFGKLIEHDIQIVATCRSGKEYNDAIRELNEKRIDILSIFHEENIIQLSRINEDTGKKIAQEVNINWNDVEFNNTIGSIFMKLSEISQRFDNIPYEKSYLKNILITTHLLHKCGLYKEKQTFLLEWIKFVCETYYEIEMKKSEWINSLDELEELHFIQVPVKDTVWVEEVYLENKYKPKQPISDLDLYRTMIDCFSNKPEVFFDCPEVLFRFANNAYYFLGISDSKKIDLYTLAKNVCEDAVVVTPKDSIEYAQYHKLLGISYRLLSEMDERDQSSNAKKAVQSCIESCKYFESNGDLLINYAICKSDLGAAYRHLAEIASKKDDKRSYCNNGIEVCEQALRIEEYPLLYRATTNNIIGTLHRILGEVELEEKNHEQVIDNCNKAIKYCKEALEIYKKNNLPLQVATTQYVFGKIYNLLAEEENSIQNCEQAIKCLKESLTVRTFKNFKIDFARTQVILGDTYLTLSKFENKLNNLTNAKAAYEAASVVFSKNEFPILHKSIQSKIQKTKSASFNSACC